jgi:ribosomal protein S17
VSSRLEKFWLFNEKVQIPFPALFFKMKIEKKVWPEYFQAILDGIKTYELRLADFECNPGDILILKEWNPNTKEYTGRVLEKEVTFVGKTKNFNFWSKEEIEKYGYQIISFK